MTWEKQGGEITGISAGDELGNSVALSADSKILVVGAPGYESNDDRTGYAAIFQWHDILYWVQIGQTIYGSENGDQLGFSVDVSADGFTLAVGAPGWWEKNDRAGYVRVYSLYVDEDSGLIWKQVGQDINGEDLGDQFGESVSLSEDGNILAVGGAYSNNQNGKSGRASIYILGQNGSWLQIGQGISGEHDGDESGESLSLSSDGTIVAVGALYNNGSNKEGCRGGPCGDRGHVRVYQLYAGNQEGTNLSWIQLGQDVDGDNPDDLFGSSVALSADGKILAVGAPDEMGKSSGYVRVYYLEGNGFSSSWRQLGQDINGEALGDRFGMAVSLSGDGVILAVGASNANGDSSGRVTIYQRGDYDSTWTQLGDAIYGESPHDNLGWSVSLSADGSTVLIGSVWNDDSGENSGHVKVFSIKQLTTATSD